MEGKETELVDDVWVDNNPGICDFSLIPSLFLMHILTYVQMCAILLPMNKRLVVLLEDEDHNRLKMFALKAKMTVSEIVRGMIHSLLEGAKGSSFEENDKESSD